MGSTEYKTWEQGLADLSSAQLWNGVKAARDFDGFFSLPAFRELCQIPAADHGLPPVEKAYEEACLARSPKARQPWSHPAVYHAGVATGWSDLHAMTRNQILPRYRYNYEQLRKRVAAGEELSRPITEALPHTVHHPTPPKEAKKRMAALRQEVGL